MTAPSEVTEEITAMVRTKEFVGMKEEFAPLTTTYADKAEKSGADAWNLMTAKIVEFLPVYITEGLISCSLETIAQDESCQYALRDHMQKLVIKPSDKFPRITFPSFYPYLEFIIRTGPVEVWKMRSTFNVEGSIYVKDATLNFTDNRIEAISGTIVASVKISLCKGKFAAKIHQFERPIHVA